MQTWIIWKENNPLLLKSNRYPRKSQKIPESTSLVTNWVFKSCFCPVAFLVSETFTSQLCSRCFAIIILHFTMKHFLVCVCVSAAVSFLSYITKVNSFSALHGSSIGGITFCVSRQICVCRVRGVCAGIGRSLDSLTPSSSCLSRCGVCVRLNDSLFCFCVTSAVDFLSPLTDQPINKQLSNSSAALHSPDRGETLWTVN